MTITSRAADYDRESVQIARQLRDNLKAVGIDVSIDLLSNEEFPRSVLLNHDFDLYVSRHRGDVDPDFLYETLHSVYADEPGWQNPFGYTNKTFDDLLERQRWTEGDDRQEAVGDVLEAIADEQPFVPICVPDEYRLVRKDRFDGWGDDHPATRLGYLGLEPLGDDGVLRASVTDTRLTENFNPLSAEYRDRGTFVYLVYDSLGTVDGNGVRPWLATAWERSGSRTTVTLRENLRWHDGERLTANDVAFTYRFLEDTSQGENDVPSPAPRYRGHASAVDSVEVRDNRTVSIESSADEGVLERAFTVPILPEHVWSDRSEEATIPGIDVAPGTTEAVVTDNVPAIGSGPFRFEDRTERETLILERFDDHFSLRDPDLPEPTVERLRFGVEPRSTAAIESIQSGDSDVTASMLEAYSIDDIEETETIDVLESPSWTFYHVGFNARTAPFANPYFRRIVARLLDKEWLVDEVFEGYATPVATPVTGSWVPESLEWDDGDPVVPFFGDDGELTETAVRRAFQDAGFRYDDEGNLLVRN